jgi:SPP1 gp7 family putative phage head morphogenesis protein
MAKTKADPTGLARTRNRAGRRLQKRLTNAERDIRQLFRNIPRTRRTQAVISNQDAAVIYDYELTTDQLQIIYQQIRTDLDAELETEGEQMPPFWWWAIIIEEVFRRGALEEVNEFNRQVGKAVAADVTVRGGLQPQVIDPDQVIRSPAYQTALRSAQVSNYPVIKSLSDRTASQVIQVLNQGIQAGDTPTTIAGTISKRFDVSRSNAMRIAQTEVNKAFNDAKIAANSVAAELTGLRPALIHISALSPTTREGHAARHGRVFTPEQQLQWWNTGANRINCKCSTEPILVDNRGNVVDTELQQELKAEKVFFED